MKVRAIDCVQYDGKQYQAGDEFECQEEHAKLFTLMNKIEKPEDKPQEDVSPRRGKYRRRDMRAEG